MTTYNTGNPVGSTDPRDLYDNAENLDEMVNSDSKQSHPDRRGVSRKTWHGMEREHDAAQSSRDDQFQSAQSSRNNQFQSAQSSREAVFSDFLQASGYQDLGEYAPGIEITSHNQYVTFGGQPYTLKPSIPVPYTTSGEWTGDDFKLIGDGSLRQDLANPDKGAAIVARGVVAVDSIADLMELPEGQRKEGLRYLVKGYHAGSDIGGGEFYYDSSRSVENDGGYVLDGFVRILTGGVISAEMFGAKCNRVDSDSAAFNAAAEAAEAIGAKLLGEGRGTGYLFGSTVNVSTDTEIRAAVVFPADGAFRYLRVVSDKVPTEVPFSSLGGLQYGSSKVTGLPEYAVGKFIHIESDEDLTERNNHPSNTPYKKNTAFYVAGPDGTIVPSLDMTFNAGFNTTVKIFPEEPRITVRLSAVESKGSGQQNGAITLRRDSVDLSGFTVRSDGAEFRTLISVEANDCTIEGVHLDHHNWAGLGYAISIGLTCKTLVSNIKSVAERSNLDGRHGALVTVRDSVFENAGTHWGNNYVFQNCHVHRYSWSGKDLDVSGGSIEDGVSLRADVSMCTGHLNIDNVEWSGTQLVRPSNPIIGGFFTSPRKVFDSITISRIRNIRAATMNLLGYGGTSVWAAQFIYPRSINISDIDCPNCPLMYPFAVPLDNALARESVSRWSARDVSIHQDGVVELLQRGITESQAAIVFDIRRCGNLRIRVDASVIRRMDVYDCQVVLMRQVNDSTGDGPIVLHGGTYDPEETAYTRAPKGLINVELVGNALLTSGSPLLFQIGCMARTGATGYTTPLDYYVNPTYYQGNP